MQTVDHVQAMMRDFSTEIIDLLSPRPAPARRRWEDAESAIGALVPPDYKALVDGLGGASIIDDWLCIFEPNSNETHLDFANWVAERDSAWKLIRGRGFVPLREEHFNNDNRLIAFAAVEANYFYWRARPDTPADRWGVLIVDADLEDWNEFDMSATACIYEILAGRIDLPAFEGLFSQSPHSFVPA